MSDPATYRTKEELEKHKKDDPITNFAATLLKEGVLTDEEYKKMDAEVKALAAESVTFAEASAEPPLEDLYKYTIPEPNPEYQVVATTPEIAKQNPFHC